MRVDSVRKMNELLGKEFETNNFGKCFVIDYKGRNDVFVMFYDPVCVVRCHLGTLNKGQIKNPLVPTFYGRGFMGIGKYGKSDSRAFSLWRSVLERTCCLSFKERRPTYKNTSVCEEWLNFQNFAAWCTTQKLFNAKDDKGKSYHLDKDILVKGCKVYSPETCRFIPQRLNKLLSTRNKLRGEYPLGVRYNKRAKLFVVTINVGAKAKHLGYFKDEQSAFQAYKTAKESFVKEQAEKWKDKIDERAYKALMDYEVSIDD